MIIRIFAAREPAKPLNDAQMCGSFLFLWVCGNKDSVYKNIFHTPWVSAASQNKRYGNNWWGKGSALSFPHRLLSLVCLYVPLLSIPKEQHLFKKGVTFGKVMMLYRFDKKLRLLLFNEIEKIEVAVRCAIVSSIFFVLHQIDLPKVEAVGMGVFLKGADKRRHIEHGKWKRQISEAHSGICR